MSWSTSLLTTIDYPRKTYKSIYDVERDIAENKETINNCIRELTSFAVMTEPSKLVPKDEDSTYDWITSKINEITDLLKEASIDLYLLELLKEQWDSCHTDNKPDTLYKIENDDLVYKDLSSDEVKKLWHGEKSYIGGDYIE